MIAFIIRWRAWFFHPKKTLDRHYVAKTSQDLWCDLVMWLSVVQHFVPTMFSPHGQGHQVVQDGSVTTRIAGQELVPWPCWSKFWEGLWILSMLCFLGPDSRYKNTKPARNCRIPTKKSSKNWSSTVDQSQVTSCVWNSWWTSRPMKNRPVQHRWLEVQTSNLHWKVVPMAKYPTAKHKARATKPRNCVSPVEGTIWTRTPCCTYLGCLKKWFLIDGFQTRWSIVGWLCSQQEYWEHKLQEYSCS